MLAPTPFAPARYSDFCSLYDKLRNWRHPSALPKLPGKTWFARSCIGPKFLSKRQQALDSFVKALASDEKLFKVPGVPEFLGVPVRANADLPSASNM